MWRRTKTKRGIELGAKHWDHRSAAVQDHFFPEESTEAGGQGPIHLCGLPTPSDSVVTADLQPMNDEIFSLDRFRFSKALEWTTRCEWTKRSEPIKKPGLFAPLVQIRTKKSYNSWWSFFPRAHRTPHLLSIIKANNVVHYAGVNKQTRRGKHL